MGQSGSFTNLARICMCVPGKLTALLQMAEASEEIVQGCQLYTCEASYIKTKEMAQSSHEIKHAISGGLLRSVSVGRSPPVLLLWMLRPTRGVQLMNDCVTLSAETAVPCT